MERFLRLALLGCAAALSAACNGVVTAPNAPAAIAAAAPQPDGASGINLYVANTGAGKSSGSVTVYGLKRGKLLASITRGVNDPSTIGYDAAAKLIAVANQGPQGGNGSVALFAPGATSPRRILNGTADPVSLAFDASGKIYVANYRAGVTIYKPGNSQPVFTIPADPGSDYYGVYKPRLVAVDSADNVYVVNGPVNYGSEIGFTLAVFAPRTTQPKYIIGTGPARAMLVVNDLLYLAWAFPKRYKRSPDGFVDVYQLGQGPPNRLLHISQAIRTPDALAVDASGDLYVANLNGQDVGFYQPGQTVPRRVISNGVHFPKSLAIGPQGDLYVSNLYVNTVTAYKAGHVDPHITIRDSIAGPVAITLDAASP